MNRLFRLMLSGRIDPTPMTSTRSASIGEAAADDLLHDLGGAAEKP
jgi:hypothetical protein